MLDELEIDQSIRLALLNLMVVLYDCGITEVHVGGIMRILGVDNQKAQEHDNEILIIDDNFLAYVEQINRPRTADQTLH